MLTTLLKLTLETLALLLIFLVAIATFSPEIYGKWKAHVEYEFLKEAERIGMWSE